MQFGRVFVETKVNAKKFAGLISALNLVPPVLIKPNWGSAECYTEAEILDWTLSAIPGEKIVIESHGWARNEEAVQKKGPVPLTKANLRKGNSWFLQTSGIDRVLAKHGVEFLNLTEEVWAGRTVDAALVQQAVEAQYPPVQIKEMYEKVPSRLYELKGGTLLSLAKYRLVFDPITVTFSLKNLFGLIPGPSRGKYHGKGDAHLYQSIVDINKIYRSLFQVKGMVEAVFSAGDFRDPSAGMKITPECGVALACEDTLTLDAFATAIAGLDPESASYLKLATGTFGAWDPCTTDDARRSKVRIF